MTDVQTRIRLSEQAQNRALEFDLRLSSAQAQALAADLGVDGLRKVSLRGTLAPENRRDWRLEAVLGATVVQPCVVTLAPVTTRIDEPVLRRYLARMPDTPAGDEVEMPEDDSIEPLPETVDLEQVLAEALALALPLYPRAEGAELPPTAVTEPGKAPLTDADLNPFAALAALRGTPRDAE